ncbi:FAD binding domain-containing protein [Chloroflexota bacterium]
MWKSYINATSIEQVLGVLSSGGERARIVAGATDLILELERGVRQGIEALVDITRIPELNEIRIDENRRIHLGPLVTHNQCVASKLIRECGFPLAQAAWQVGAPQIRNRGTVAGNLITASPANDTITPLMALGADITLRSQNDERIVPIRKFYLGVRRTVMRPNEMLVDISFPAMGTDERGIFLKLGLRQAQAISVVNIALLLGIVEDTISKVVITLGSVAPTIIYAEEASAYLEGKVLTEETIAETALLAMDAARPIDDIRGSATYRREMVRVLTSRGLRSILSGKEQSQFPSNPVYLWGQDYPDSSPYHPRVNNPTQGSQISTTVNGKQYLLSVNYDKTLLDFLRDDLGLIGTKEGCAEGECGACTVWLDGIAVMACLVPAPRADGANIVTVEGLANVNQLHRVQNAFIQEGAVQCGYCTPGFLMSAAKLLEETQQPSRQQIKEAITGNLCRCTGYYKIIDAIEKASLEVDNG